jgi:hypothetical protein
VFEAQAENFRGTFSGDLFNRASVDFAVDFWDSKAESNDQLEAKRPSGCQDDQSAHGNFGTRRNPACESELHASVEFMLQEMGSPAGMDATMSKIEMRHLWLDGVLPVAFAARAPADCIDVKAGHLGCQACLDAIDASPSGEAKYCRCVAAKLAANDQAPAQFNARCA